MFCKDCGTEVDGKFCQECGMPIKPKNSTPAIIKNLNLIIIMLKYINANNCNFITNYSFRILQNDV